MKNQDVRPTTVTSYVDATKANKNNIEGTEVEEKFNTDNIVILKFWSQWLKYKIICARRNLICGKTSYVSV